MTARVRMTLDLSPKLNAELERLAEVFDMPKSGTLRFGVEMLIAAHKAKEEGFSVGAWSDDRRSQREFIGL